VTLPLETYSILPSIRDTAHHSSPDYPTTVVTAARCADRFGYTGCLLHYNLHNVDPWALVPLLLAETASLVPLIATPATAMPPHTLARNVAGFAAAYGRRLAINVITGADPAELAMIGDDAGHDARYARAEAHLICARAMMAGDTVSVRTPYFRYDRFRLEPAVDAALMPEVFVAGTSAAGHATAARVGGVAITHATDPGSAETRAFFDRAGAAGLATGVRLGIVARPDPTQAWRVAEASFPPDRRGSLIALQKLTSESEWMRNLARHAAEGVGGTGGLWFGPFSASRSHSAYLVGSYDEVAEVLAEYQRLGMSRLLLDGPYGEEEFSHTQKALLRLGSPTSSASRVG
jgi:alkanesulfonate monooxygenase